MEFLEYPLLHYADLMLALLHAGDGKEATLDDAATMLAQELDRAHEHPPIGRDEMMARLAAARRHLVEARLLQNVGGGRFSTTARGRHALTEHPDGVDDTVLMEYREFRDYLHRRATHPAPEDCCGDFFREGYAKQQAGMPHSANPYRQDTAAHLAWENGWFAARDEANAHGRGDHR